MPNASITKAAIIESSKELLRQKSLDKLSVAEIAEASGVNRNTFYYHFQDKYDLLTWIFEQELCPTMLPFLENNNLAGSFVALCDCMRQDPLLYTALFVAAGHLSLPDTILSYYKRYLTVVSGQNNILSDYQPHERDVVVRFYSHAFIGLLTDWVKGGMQDTPSSMAHTITDTLGKQIFKLPDTMP